MPIANNKFVGSVDYRLYNPCEWWAEKTEWFACQACGKLAETCNQYLTKGKQVYVEGR